MSCLASDDYYERRYQDLIEQYQTEGYSWEDAERLAYCKLRTEEVLDSNSAANVNMYWRQHERTN